MNVTTLMQGPYCPFCIAFAKAARLKWPYDYNLFCSLTQKSLAEGHAICIPYSSIKSKLPYFMPYPCHK